MNQEKSCFQAEHYEFAIAPLEVGLSPNTADVWRLRIGEVSGGLGQLQSWLSDGELERANRFHFDKDRQRFISGRGILRVLLGDYLACSPSEIVFSYSDYNKPTLVGPGAPEKISFNLAHSGDLILYAFAQDVSVGIDVEREDPLREIHDIARRFFAPAEYVAWQAVDDGLKEHAFFLCWTRKEAFIKAIGEGLSHPLDRFEVSLDPTGPARLLSIDGDPEAAREWSLTNLEVGAGYAAALAIDRNSYGVRCWHYNRERLATHGPGG